VRVVAERHLRQLQPPEALDVDLAVRIDEDVADFLVEQQRRDGPEVEGVVHQLGDQALFVGARQADVGLDDQPARHALDLSAALGIVQRLEHGEVELGDQLAVQA